MRRLPSVIVLLVLAANLYAQKSPHGDSFKTNCSDCHKTDTWKVDLKTVSFDHSKTKFSLVGQHREITCTDCHKSLDFAIASTECNDCHTDIHEQTVGNECARCHTPNSWMVTSITQLHQLSRFPLIGPHTIADCKDCHKNLLESTPATGTASRLRFDPLGVECYDCHKNNYMATTAPNHVQSNYSTNCDQCHKMNYFSWTGASFNHTIFPLEGVHKSTPCTSCHTNGYANTPNTCAGCHLKDYNQTTNPNHITAQFPTTCEVCHTPSGWAPSTFNHSSVYPLIGAHTTVACTLCHTTGYVNTPNTCAGCHLNDYNKTTNPNHTTAQFPTTCEVCHTPTAWVPSTFNHSTVYPLTGAHTTVACALCHTTGYVNTPTTCAGCHTNNYNQTTNPSHTAANFPNTCSDCHSTTAWTPSTWNHTYFPISSGRHNLSCATCHTNPANYAVFTCVTPACHANAHNQNQGSAGCYSCHPTGQGD